MAYRKTTSVCVLAILSVMGLAACDSVTRYSDDKQPLPPRTGEGLVLKPNSPIGDAPMPIGFVVVESQSRAHASAGSRTIHHVLQGQATRADVVNFYRATLSQYQWERKSEVIGPSQIDLAWTKGREVLTIKLTTKGSIAKVELDIHNATAGDALKAK